MTSEANKGGPLLYSFRRCPYAIRARLALLLAEQRYRLHEVSFKAKPIHMLEISPKGTVPVLQLLDGQVLQESLDIVLWALAQNDPQGYMTKGKELALCMTLIEDNDGEFKYWLDRYKYADRHPQQSTEFYRGKGELFFRQLEARLLENSYLLGASPSLADIAILPFVRQFAHVDKAWFGASPYPELQRWLEGWLNSEVFLQVMAKVPKCD